MATVANAASINGDFKGNPIVKVKDNGKELIVENTPAIIYNGNTLVPIYMLRQLGATVTWDQKTYSVDVDIPQSDINLVELYQDIQAYRFFLILSDQNAHLSACIRLLSTSSSNDEIKQALEEVARIDEFLMNLSMTGVIKWEYKGADQFKYIVDSIIEAKRLLEALNTEKAQTKFIIAQSNLNSLYDTLDDRMIEHLSKITPLVMDENYNFKLN